MIEIAPPPPLCPIIKKKKKKNYFDNVIELVGDRSVIDGATPSRYILQITRFI